MLFRLRKYISFLFSSRNEHGIHSPFVYNFITKCLFSQPHVYRNKSQNVLIKSIQYFNARKLYLIPADDKLRLDLLSKSPEGIITFIKNQPDILYVSDFDSKKNMDQVSEYIHTNSTKMVIISDLYRSRERFTAWNKLTAMANIPVTLDLYYCGILFLHRNQVKEHFKIRI